MNCGTSFNGNNDDVLPVFNSGYGSRQTQIGTPQQYPEGFDIFGPLELQQPQPELLHQIQQIQSELQEISQLIENASDSSNGDLQQLRLQQVQLRLRLLMLQHQNVSATPNVTESQQEVTYITEYFKQTETIQQQLQQQPEPELESSTKPDSLTIQQFALPAQKNLAENAKEDTEDAAPPDLAHIAKAYKEMQQGFLSPESFRPVDEFLPGDDLCSKEPFDMRGILEENKERAPLSLCSASAEIQPCPDLPPSQPSPLPPSVVSEPPSDATIIASDSVPASSDLTATPPCFMSSTTKTMQNSAAIPWSSHYLEEVIKLSNDGISQPQKQQQSTENVESTLRTTFARIKNSISLLETSEHLGNQPVFNIEPSEQQRKNSIDQLLTRKSTIDECLSKIVSEYYEYALLIAPAKAFHSLHNNLHDLGNMFQKLFHINFATIRAADAFLSLDMGRLYSITAAQKAATLLNNKAMESVKPISDGCRSGVEKSIEEMRDSAKVCGGTLSDSVGNKKIREKAAAAKKAMDVGYLFIGQDVDHETLGTIKSSIMELEPFIGFASPYLQRPSNAHDPIKVLKAATGWIRSTVSREPNRYIRCVPIPSSNIVTPLVDEEKELIWFLQNYPGKNVSIEDKARFMSKSSCQIQKILHKQDKANSVLQRSTMYGDPVYVNWVFNGLVADHKRKGISAVKKEYLPCILDDNFRPTSMADVWSPDARVTFEATGRGMYSWIGGKAQPLPKYRRTIDKSAIYLVSLKAQSSLEKEQQQQLPKKRMRVENPQSQVPVPDLEIDKRCFGFKMERYLCALPSGIGFLWQATVISFKNELYVSCMATLYFTRCEFINIGMPKIHGVSVLEPALFKLVLAGGETWSVCVYEISDGTIGSLLKQPNTEWIPCAGTSDLMYGQDNADVKLYDTQYQRALTALCYPELAMSRFYRPIVTFSVAWARVRTVVFLLQPAFEAIATMLEQNSPIYKIALCPDAFCYSLRGSCANDPATAPLPKMEKCYASYKVALSSWMRHGWRTKYRIKLVPIPSPVSADAARICSHYFWLQPGVPVTAATRLVHSPFESEANRVNVPIEPYPGGALDDEFLPLWAVFADPFYALRSDFQTCQNAACAQMITIARYTSIRAGTCSPPQVQAEAQPSYLGGMIAERAIASGDKALQLCHSSDCGLPFEDVLKILDRKGPFYNHLFSLSSIMVQAAQLGSKLQTHPEDIVSESPKFRQLFEAANTALTELSELMDLTIKPRATNQFETALQFDKTTLM